jgi:hypothetical protein
MQGSLRSQGGRQSGAQLTPPGSRVTRGGEQGACRGLIGKATNLEAAWRAKSADTAWSVGATIGRARSAGSAPRAGRSKLIVYTENEWQRPLQTSPRFARELRAHAVCSEGGQGTAPDGPSSRSSVARNCGTSSGLVR